MQHLPVGERRFFFIGGELIIEGRLVSRCAQRTHIGIDDLNSVIGVPLCFVFEFRRSHEARKAAQIKHHGEHRVAADSSLIY